MDAALRRFERYLHRHFGHSSTAKHYLNDLKLFIGIIGHTAPEAVTAANIDDFVDYQTDKRPLLIMPRAFVNAGDLIQN